jgi:hypothetical protein
VNMRKDAYFPETVCNRYSRLKSKCRSHRGRAGLQKKLPKKGTHLFGQADLSELKSFPINTLFWGFTLMPSIEIYDTYGVVTWMSLYTRVWSR